MSTVYCHALRIEDDIVMPVTAGMYVVDQAYCSVRSEITSVSYGMFKPSIAEVISCIPEYMWKKVYAFEIVDKPRDASDLNKEREALNAGFHVATTRLYLKP